MRILSPDEVKWWREHRCTEPNCNNIVASGYVLCHGHLFGFPQAIPSDILEQIGAKN